MARWNIGAKNGLWKGGRTVTEHGYVLIRVGLDHPLADVRGYAYEHRVVLSKKIGRWLKNRELAHHKNGNRQDNHPDNLELCGNQFEHHVKHRNPGSNRRLPSQRNRMVSCRCGCGAKFKRFDSSGRPRRFVSGHNH